MLRVAAAGTAETPLVLTRPVVLDPSRMTVSGTGRVAGFAVLRTTGELVGAEARVEGWTHTAGGDRVVRVATHGGALRLTPGRYRLVVFADGPAQVAVPLTSGSSQSLRPRTPPRRGRG